MVGEWVKMRVWIAREPKVIAIADHLGARPEYLRWALGGKPGHCGSCHVASHVTVSVTVAALLHVWGVANEVGKAEGDDLILDHCTLHALDEIACVPRFGQAMASVGWAAEERDAGGPAKVRLTKFMTHNVPADDRGKRADLERQRRCRAKRQEARGRSEAACHTMSHGTGHVTVMRKEEERGGESPLSSTDAVIEGPSRPVAWELNRLPWLSPRDGPR
jgi:hypothetical protein